MRVDVNDLYDKHQPEIYCKWVNGCSANCYVSVEHRIKKKKKKLKK